MKIITPSAVVAVMLAIAGAAHADPVLMHGTGPTSAPAGMRSAATTGFGASFRLGGARGEMQFNAAGSSSQTYMLRQELGSLKQVKDVLWSFVLHHDARTGYTMSMTGTRNEERTQTTRTIKWNQTYGASTPWATAPGAGSAAGSPMNALQLAARASHETISSGVSFTNLRFQSATLGTGGFGSGTLASRGVQNANLWLAFDPAIDLRLHTWTITGFVSGFRNSSLGGENSVGLDIFGQTMLAVVPLPPAAWAGLSTLAGVAGVGIIRRRRQASTC